MVFFVPLGVSRRHPGCPAHNGPLSGDDLQAVILYVSHLFLKIHIVIVSHALALMQELIQEKEPSLVVIDPVSSLARGATQYDVSAMLLGGCPP